MKININGLEIETEREKMTDPIPVVKQALLNDAFKYYQDLIKFLKSLPLEQNIPGFVHALLEIDTGMLWIKEIIMTNDLIIPAKPPIPVTENEPCAPPENCT